MHGLFLLLLLFPAAKDAPWPAPDWTCAAPSELGMDEAALRRARDYALSSGGSGLVVHRGRQVAAWGDLTRRYDLKSTTKSFGTTALGLAVTDGKVKLGDKASKYHPTLGVPPETNRRPGWLDEITLLHLATQTAGFAKRGGFEPLLFRPGTKWHYSDGGLRGGSLGRRSGRIGRLFGQVDWQRRPNAMSRLLRRRQLLGPQGDAEDSCKDKFALLTFSEHKGSEP